MMASLLMHICITRPQWVYILAPGRCANRFICVIFNHFYHWYLEHIWWNCPRVKVNIGTHASQVIIGSVCCLMPLANNSIMMLVKFLTSANQKNRIRSCDESRLCNPRPRLLGDEVVVGPSLMFRKMDPWNAIRNIWQDKTNKNQL